VILEIFNRQKWGKKNRQIFYVRFSSHNQKYKRMIKVLCLIYGDIPPNNKTKNSKMLCFWTFSIARSERKKIVKIDRFLSWVFSLWPKNVKGWLKFCASYMARFRQIAKLKTKNYSQIWINLCWDVWSPYFLQLAMDDHHFGYKNFLKQKFWL
jgi:hypothetical protein